MDLKITPIVPISRSTLEVPIVLKRTYVPMQSPKQDETVSAIVKLAAYGVSLARTDPKKAETLAKTCIAIGAVGVGIWALAKILS